MHRVHHDPHLYDFTGRRSFVVSHSPFAPGRGWIGPPLGSSGVFYVLGCFSERKVGLVVAHVTGGIVRAEVRSAEENVLKGEPEYPDLDGADFVEVGIRAAALLVHELAGRSAREGLSQAELRKRGVSPELLDAFLREAGALHSGQLPDGCLVRLSLSCTLPSTSSRSSARAPRPPPEAKEGVYACISVRTRAAVIRSAPAETVGVTEVREAGQAVDWEMPVPVRFSTVEDPYARVTVCRATEAGEGEVIGACDISLGRLSAWFPIQWTGKLVDPMNREEAGELFISAEAPRRLPACEPAAPPLEGSAAAGAWGPVVALLLPKTDVPPGVEDAPLGPHDMEALEEERVLKGWRFQLDDLCAAGTADGFGGLETREDLIRRLDSNANRVLWTGFCRYGAVWLAAAATQKDKAEAERRARASRMLLRSASEVKDNFRSAHLIQFLACRSADLLPLCFEHSACQRDLERPPGAREFLGEVPAVRVRPARPLRSGDYEECARVILRRAFVRAERYPRLVSFFQGLEAVVCPQLVPVLADILADPRYGTDARDVVRRLSRALTEVCPPFLSLIAGMTCDSATLLNHHRLITEGPPGHAPSRALRGADHWRPMPSGVDDVEADVFCSAMPRDSGAAMGALFAPPLPGTWRMNDRR
eukprot:Hpha_TRINITY_DN5500_c0_g1::TRINITY_DN5500_c0_g1_i1::g.93723::m.93723